MNRRHLLIGIGALACTATRAQAQTRDAALYALFDAFTPAALESFDPAGLSDHARLDYDVVLWQTRLNARIKAGGGYGLHLEQQLGMALDPEAVHQRLEDSASAITVRADTLLKDQGLHNGSVGERLKTLARDERYLYSDNDTGRDRAVADMNAALDAVLPHLPALFGDLPPNITNARVRRMSPADEASGRGGYRDMAAGAYFVDLSAIRQRPSWSLPSVAYHELLPGHRIQLGLQALIKPHPLRLACAPAFAEGWAIYAEQLAAEAGLYNDQPLRELGYLQWLLFRLGRGLADTGQHVRGWTAEQTLRRLETLQGDPAIFAPFARDIDRIRADPGARAAEALQWLLIADWRTHFAATPPAFHHTLLAQGALPAFALLQRLDFLVPPSSAAGKPAHITMPHNTKGE